MCTCSGDTIIMDGAVPNYIIKKQLKSQYAKSIKLNWVSSIRSFLQLKYHKSLRLLRFPFKCVSYNTCTK